MSTLVTKRRGRPPKGQGPREELRGLVPACLKVAAEQRAAEMGFHITDYLAYLVSTDTGIAIPAQEGLSLGLTA